MATSAVFAEARVALDGDVVRVYGGVGLKVVHQARGSPGPGAESAPVVGLAELAAVAEADDPGGEAAAVVCLEAGGIEEREAPALGEGLLPGRGAGRGGAAAASCRCRRGGCGGWGGARRARRRGRGAERTVEGDLDDDGDRLGCGGGEDEVGFDVDGEGRVGGVVDVADETLGDGGDSVLRPRRGRRDLPADGGDVGRNATENLAVEELDQLGTALVPPDLGGGDGLAVVQDERIGQVGPGVGPGLVPVDGIGAGAVLRDAGAQRGDVQEVHHVLVVRGDGGLGRGGCGLGGLRRGRLREGRHEQEGERESERVGAHGVAETIADSRRDWHWGAQRKAPHPVARWDCAPRMGHPVPAEDGTPARTDKGKYRGPSLRSG